ncbi:MAG: hypothetical protein PUK54_11220 [Firmicutes bacterium]|nr:hypothetical protein [Bacillota bacterium]MDD7603140.1 hypothetical protein [Bacillota bacterium]MDY5856204.1 hypothetical protein [Anaerovoracaceae bacterium]
MNRILALLLTLMLILSGFTACGSKDGTETEGNDVTAGDEAAGTDEETGDEDGLEADEETGDQADSDTEKSDADQSGSDHQTESKPSSGTSGNGSSGSSAGSSGSPTSSSGSSASSSSGSSGSSSGSKPSSDKKDEIKAPSGTPSEIIDQIYEKKSVDLPLGTTEVDLSDTEMANVITGISSLDLVESAAYSESMMGSQAYSLVVVKVKNKKNTEAIANEMLNGINQSKWICVTADDLRVAAAGDVAVLIMVDSGFKDTVTAKEIVNAFKSLCGGLDVSLSK